MALAVEEIVGMHSNRAVNVLQERARQALEHDFGVIVSTRGDAPWTVEQLERVHEAFSLLDPSARKTLAGLELIRAHVPPASQRDDICGLYETNTATRDGRRVRAASITWFDRAFMIRARPSDAPINCARSLAPILREVAHAVAQQALANAIVADNIALEKERAASFALARALKDFASRVEEMNEAIRFAAAGLADCARDPMLAPLSEVAAAMLRVGRAKTQRMLDRALVELDAAIEKRDAGKPNLEITAQIQDRAVSACKSAAMQRAGCFAAREDRAKTRRALAEVSEHGFSLRLVDFEQTMRRSRERPVTGFGAQGVAEAHAEAFTFFLCEPKYLRCHRPAMYAHFAKLAEVKS